MSGDGPASAAQAANLGLRFLLELAVLAALGYWGFHTGTSPLGDIALGVGAPVVAAAVWGTWAAPKSARQLTGGRLLALQLANLGAGAAALIAAGHTVLGAVFAVVIIVNAAALQALGEGSRVGRAGG